MTLANRFNLLLHLCVLLGTLAFCAADSKPLLALLAIGATLACYLFSRGERADRPPMLPRTAINVLVFAAIVNAALRASGNTINDEFVSTLGQFLVFVVLIKLLDRRAPRDDAQLLTLTIFISVAAVLTAGSLPVGLLLMAYVPTVVATAMMWQLRAGQVMLAMDARANAALGESSVAGNAGGPEVAMGRRPRRAFVGVCVTAVLASSAMATGVFVLLPRGIGNDLFGRFGVTQQAQIGFREAVQLGESGFLSENPTPVMDVQLTTTAGETLGSSGETLYLRGAARDEYNAALRVWEDPSAGRETERRPDGVPEPEVKKDVILNEGYEHFLTLRGTIPRVPGRDAPLSAVAQRVQKITMRGESAAGTIFALWRPLSITPDRRLDARISPRNGTMRHTTAVGAHSTYTIKSALADEVGWPPLPPRGFQEGRIHELAKNLLAPRGASEGGLSARQRVTTIRDYLRTTYGYTLEMVAPPEGVDPIEYFLFERRKGHCEYFASAMAAMCQSQGIPCRVITGYVATEFNTLTGQYLVRESNAHAWVEAFVVSEPETGNGRWETYDASPPGEIERIHRPAGGIFASLRSWYDALEFGWSSSVIGYDNAGSRRTGAERGASAAWARRFDGWSDRVVEWMKTVRADPSRVPWWVKYSPVALLVMVGLWVSLRARVTRWAGWTGKRSARAAFGISAFRPSGYYARTLRALERAGVPKPEQTPPGLHADALEARSPEAAATLRSIAATFYRSHFGGGTLDARELAAVGEEVRRLEAALRSSGRKM